MKLKPFRKVILAFMVIFFVLAGIAGFFSSITVAEDKREIGPNDIQGEIISINKNFLGRGHIEVKSDLTQEVYMFYMVTGTVYIPDRNFAVGDTIKVTYFNEGGKLKAARVQLIRSLR